MTAVAETAETADHATGPADPTRRRGTAPRVIGSGILAAIASVAAAVGAGEQPTTAGRALAAIVMVWAVAGVTAAVRRPDEWLGPLVVGVALASSIGVAAPALLGSGAADVPSVDRLTLWAACLTGAMAFHVALALPDGSVGRGWRRWLAAAGYAAGVVLGAVAGGRIEGRSWVLPVAAAAAIAVGAYVDRCRRAGPADRARLQWVGWGAVVTGLVSLLAAVLHQLLGWPHEPAAVAIVATALVPVSIALGAVDHLAVRVDRLLTHTIVVAGLTALVAAVYLVVVLGLGDVPDDESRRLLGLSMVAAMVAAALALPTRRRLDEIAHQRVYGDRRSPDEALHTFGSRMSRAVPMDELLLQLAETLKASMRLSSAEVWTGADGSLERSVAIPDRGPRRLAVTGEELAVVSRAKVSGNAWLAVWMPDLLDGRSDRLVRMAPVAHSGKLLGLIVVERTGDGIPFVEEEDRVLTELARQVGLALHNVRLDSALQASLQELEVRNEQLQASRLRIVSAADESRRAIERNLHDGAQQHLVALAVKVGLIRQLMAADPATADTLLEELRGDVQATLTELRDLAHGIYPPLLRERGLGEALRTAANRSPLATRVTADVGRYPSEVEAAVYFCCLEAMQNAAKHAGEDATITVDIAATADELRIDIGDDGAGFDPAETVGSHGFVNMADRVGAVGGSFEVASAPGEGTVIRCRIPARELIADA